MIGAFTDFFFGFAVWIETFDFGNHGHRDDGTWSAFAMDVWTFEAENCFVGWTVFASSGVHFWSERK